MYFETDLTVICPFLIIKFSSPLVSQALTENLVNPMYNLASQGSKSFAMIPYLTKEVFVYLLTLIFLHTRMMLCVLQFILSPPGATYPYLAMTAYFWVLFITLQTVTRCR